MLIAPSLSRTNSACQLNTEERVEKLLSIGYSHTRSRSELGCEHLEPVGIGVQLSASHSGVGRGAHLLYPQTRDRWPRVAGANSGRESFRRSPYRRIPRFRHPRLGDLDCFNARHGRLTSIQYLLPCGLIRGSQTSCAESVCRINITDGPHPWVRSLTRSLTRVRQTARGGCIFPPVLFSPLPPFDGVEGRNGKTATPLVLGRADIGCECNGLVTTITSELMPAQLQFQPFCRKPLTSFRAGLVRSRPRGVRLGHGR